MGLVKLSWHILRIVLLLPSALFQLLVVSVRTTHGVGDKTTQVGRERG